MYYAIDRDNDVTVHDSAPAAQDGTILFATEKQFAKASAEWPISRLVELWNSFAGVAGPFGDLKPVTKFMDRQTGIKRIWKAIQLLAEDVMRASIRDAEAKLKAAQATAELVGDDVEERFAALEKQDEVERLLAGLKARRSER